MRYMVVVMTSKVVEFSCQADGIPERGLIKAIAPDGASVSLDERVFGAKSGRKSSLLHEESLSRERRTRQGSSGSWRIALTPQPNLLLRHRAIRQLLCSHARSITVARALTTGG